MTRPQGRMARFLACVAELRAAARADADWAVSEPKPATDIAEQAAQSTTPQTYARTVPVRPLAPSDGYRALGPEGPPGKRPLDEGEPRDCRVHGVTWRGGPDCWAQGANGIHC